VSRTTASPSEPPPPGKLWHQRGFTLIELMVVVLIMGTVLLLVPVNMGNLGARGKFTGTANSLVAAVTGARERAILDAYEVALQLGTFRTEDGDWRHGWRFRFTNIPAKEVAGDEGDAGSQQDQREARSREREWLYTTWHPCQDGIEIAGISQRKGIWQKLPTGGEAHEIRFYADGTVEGGVAIRLESLDLDVEREFKVITVFINGLTSEASWSEGELELPEALPSSTFGN
jgi:prepilin-type N-terminal cleavage/methylation domain-containing protein